MLSRVASVAGYLVVKALCNEQRVLRALELWSFGAGPSRIALETGLSKDQVRGYVQRVYERLQSYSRVVAVLKALIPLVKALEPIVVNGVCRVCGAHVGEAYTALMHVRSRHRDLVEKHVFEILCELKKRVVKA
jgi:hypothetical protein